MGFCGWAGNPPKENKILIIKDADLDKEYFMI
jgi:hypothetical protein